MFETAAALVLAAAVVFAARHALAHWHWSQYRRAVIENNWFDPEINPNPSPSPSLQGSTDSR